MPQVIADLSDLRQEGHPGVPFLCGQTGFTGEIMQVCDDAIDKISESRVGALRVDQMDIIGDVIGGEVLE